MTEKEKINLANKVAPTSVFSVDEILEIINKAIASLESINSMGYFINTDIDEEYLKKLIWAKTIKGDRE